jgi:hypothetical protein
VGGAVHGAVSDASVESLVLMCLTVIQHLIHTQGLIQHVIDAICVHVTAALQFFLAADGALASPTCPNLCFPRPSLSLSPLRHTPPPPRPPTHNTDTLLATDPSAYPNCNQCINTATTATHL